MFSCFHIYSFHVLIYYVIAAGNIHHKHTQAPSVALAVSGFPKRDSWGRSCGGASMQGGAGLGRRSTVVRRRPRAGFGQLLLRVSDTIHLVTVKTAYVVK